MATFGGLPNLAGVVENPVEGIGAALANAPVAAADQNAALAAKGWQQLAPYITAASRNPNLMQNNTFVGQMQRIAQMYRIQGPMLNEAIAQVRNQLGGTGSAAMTGGRASTGQPSGGGAVQTGPATVAPSNPQTGQPSSQSSAPSGTPSASSPSQSTPVGSEPQLGTKWADPRLQQLASVYNQDLEAAARTPGLTGHPDFQQKIIRDGRAVGRTNQEIAADVKAYQVKAGKGPHPETMPADQANIRATRQQALQAGASPTQSSPTNPSPGSSGTNTAPSSQDTQTQNSQPQVSAVPPGTPGAGAAGPTTYQGPHALPPAMQGLMAAAGVTPTGMQAYGQQPLGAAEAQAISQAQPADRALMFANFGIDPTTVPSDIMNAKPSMTEGQRGIEWNRIYGEAMGLVKQGQDPTGIIQGAASAGVITPDMAVAFLQQPSVMEPLRGAAQQNAQILADNGLLKGARYNAYLSQIATAATTQQLHEAQIKYLGTQTKMLGPLDQSRIAEAMAGVQRDEATVDSIENGSWYQQNEANRLSLTDQVRSAQSLLSSAQRDYNTLLQIGSKPDPLTGQPRDMTQVDVGGGMKYPQALQAAKQRLDAARSAFQVLTNGAAGRQADSVVNSAAGGAKVKGRAPFAVPPGYTAEQRGGRWGVVDSNGVWYPKQ